MAQVLVPWNWISLFTLLEKTSPKRGRPNPPVSRRSWSWGSPWPPWWRRAAQCRCSLQHRAQTWTHTHSDIIVVWRTPVFRSCSMPMLTPTQGTDLDTHTQWYHNYMKTATIAVPDFFWPAPGSIFFLSLTSTVFLRASKCQNVRSRAPSPQHWLNN